MRLAWHLLASVAAGPLLYLATPMLAPLLGSVTLAYVCVLPVDSKSRKLPRRLVAAIVTALLVALRQLRMHCVGSELYKT